LEGIVKQIGFKPGVRESGSYWWREWRINRNRRRDRCGKRRHSETEVLGWGQTRDQEVDSTDKVNRKAHWKEHGGCRWTSKNGKTWECCQRIEQR